MLYIIEDAINGILMGSIYGLTALGLTIIFGVLKVINFAHGSLLMVGMYVAYWTVALTGTNPYLALVLVVPIMFFFGYYLQDIVIVRVLDGECLKVRAGCDGSRGCGHIRVARILIDHPVIGVFDIFPRIDTKRDDPAR